MSVMHPLPEVSGVGALFIGGGVSHSSGERRADVAVVIGTYDAARLQRLDEAVASVLNQSLEPSEVLVVVDNSPELAAMLTGRWSEVTVVDHRGPAGVSGMRNAGIAASSSGAVAFLDDDAVAGDGWTESLVQALSGGPQVIGVGGSIHTRWNGPAPRWFPEAFDWVVGGTSASMPSTRGAVRNLRGGNMCLRRDVFERAGDFSPAWGHNGSVAAYCDETEMCIRATSAIPGSTLLFEPMMSVDHHVTSARATLRFFLQRCYLEGKSKAALSMHAGPRQLGVERRYASVVVPRAVLKGLADTLHRGDRFGAARSLTSLMGIGAAALGYLKVRVRPLPTGR